MPKQWVCNVGATVIGVSFVDWVGARVKQRNEQVTQEKNMLIVAQLVGTVCSKIILASSAKL